MNDSKSMAPSQPAPPPTSQEELAARAAALAGLTLGAAAARVGTAVPADLRRAKGWVGQVLEAVLGASGGARAVHDFPHLAIELKTLPLGADGLPRETTYVCTADLTNVGDQWEGTWVGRKLSHVLWVPVEADPGLPPGERRIGSPWFWRPDADELAVLRADWESFREQLLLEGAASLTAHAGEALQIRPKAAHGRARTTAYDADGHTVSVNPRGFYLRTTFTRRLLERAWGRS
ncbi:MAG: DNA mismatch repair endonuclease MutH [Thiohalospira sp.]